MADLEQEIGFEESVTLNSDVIQDSVTQLLRSKLGSEEWNPVKVNGWIEDIESTILKDLADMKKPFKYIVNAVLMQKTGAPLSTGFISLWDNTKDGMVHIPFENDTIHCLITVFFVKID